MKAHIPLQLVPLFLAIIGPGCAALRPYDPPPPPPSDDVRARIGIVGVACDIQGLTPDLQKPQGKGAAAATGAGYGALCVLDLAGRGGGGGELGALVAVAFVVTAMPVALITGSIVGAVEGVSEKERAKAEAAVTNALIELAVPELLQDRCMEHAHQLVTNSVVSWTHPFDPTGASTQRVDTLLEVRLLGLRLVGQTGINPRLGLAIILQPTLIRAENHQEVYSYCVAYFDGAVLTAADPKRLKKLLAWYTRTKEAQRVLPWKSRPAIDAIQAMDPPNERKFTEWAQEEACALRAEVCSGTEVLAHSIVDHLFIRQAQNSASGSH